jgi:hypothetical protein
MNMPAPLHRIAYDAPKDSPDYVNILPNPIRMTSEI